MQELLRPSDSNKGADVLFNILKSRCAEQAVDCAEALAESVLYPDKLQEAQVLAREMAITREAIYLLEQIASGEDKGGESFNYTILTIGL